VSVVVYIHESLTPEQALSLLVEHHKAWCVNRPGDAFRERLEKFLKENGFEFP